VGLVAFFAFVPEAVRILTSQSVAALAAIGPFVPAHNAFNGLPREIPVVAVESAPEPDISLVTVDQVAGARLATEHLLRLGCETVFHVAGPNDWPAACARTAGRMEALSRAGAQVIPPLQGDWTARSGYRAGQLLAQMPHARAIFAANDHMALGVVRALHDRGRQVPGDVAVVGFDDTPESAFFIPPLTTISQDNQGLGNAAVQLLVDQLQMGAKRQDKVLIAPDLDCRQSSRWAT
jgi:DNA-binding LacI/PurR family transcriptional regulator